MKRARDCRLLLFFALLATLAANLALAQAPGAHKSAAKPAATEASYARPKLVVLLVVDQMRADYLERFQEQWIGGLKRLMQEGAWFREAACHYAATETCVGDAKI